MRRRGRQIGRDAAGIAAKTRIELLQSLEQAKEVFGRTRIEDVQVEREHGRALEHARRHADDDEHDLMSREKAQQRGRVSRAAHGR